MKAADEEHTTLLRRGLVGSVIAAICCFTPLLVVIVAGVGLSAFVGWLDYALFPMLFASLGVIAYALWLRAGQPGRSPKALVIGLAVAFSGLLFWLEFRFALRISVVAALAVAGYALWLGRSGGAAAEPIDGEPR
ncbi:mercury resistance system transport protein MerF [Rhodobacteraceae bacterium 2CG4]|uniref:Mercury resistance system transport protein MerF n=1 Tax=Halovulum marinum TaxID=2662447 RepID=A0A6L5Z2N6_9RHOB|nr:mercury resistance system transport protein MerF [Halovulum marinum]MSU90345.1 mercury resistance system transport protein MerF [Halovulum marinum]